MLHLSARRTLNLRCAELYLCLPTGVSKVSWEIDHIEGLRNYLNMLLLIALTGCVFGIASFGILCWLGFGG